MCVKGRDGNLQTPIWSNNNPLAVPNLCFVWYSMLGPSAEQHCWGKFTIRWITKTSAQTQTHSRRKGCQTLETFERSHWIKKDNLHCQRKGFGCITFWIRKGGKLNKETLFTSLETQTHRRWLQKFLQIIFGVFCLWKSNEDLFTEKQLPQARWFSVYQHVALCRLWHSKCNAAPQPGPTRRNIWELNNLSVLKANCCMKWQNFSQ